MCICVCACMYVYLRACVHVTAFTFVVACTCVRVCVCLRTLACMRACTWYSRVRALVRILTRTENLYVAAACVLVYSKPNTFKRKTSNNVV